MILKRINSIYANEIIAKYYLILEPEKLHKLFVKKNLKLYIILLKNIIAEHYIFYVNNRKKSY